MLVAKISFRFVNIFLYQFKQAIWNINNGEKELNVFFFKPAEINKINIILLRNLKGIIQNNNVPLCYIKEIFRGNNITRR